MKHKSMANYTDREILLQMQIQMEHLQNEVEKMSGKIDRLELRMKADYVSKEEYDPIKKLVYGTVGLIITAVATALISLLINTGGAPTP